MTATSIRQIGSAMMVAAAIVTGLVISSGSAFAMPKQVGLTTNDSDQVVTVHSIGEQDTNDHACQTKRCAVPGGTLTQSYLNRLRLVPAGPGQVGFVTYINGQMVVADGVKAPSVRSSTWRGFQR